MPCSLHCCGSTLGCSSRASCHLGGTCEVRAQSRLRLHQVDDIADCVNYEIYFTAFCSS